VKALIPGEIVLEIIADADADHITSDISERGASL
jgi:hypothetical protein